MGIFTSSLLGDVIKGVFGVVDDLHMSGEEKADAKFRITQLAAAADIAQIEVNKQEAKSGLLFVSGWRPFVGWTCGSALAWTFVVSPIVNSIAFYVAEFTGNTIDMSGLPTFDLAIMMPVLLGMLGLGSLRTYEKVQGVERKSMTISTDKDTPALKRGKQRGT
jgi:hypothetical protein